MGQTIRCRHCADVIGVYEPLIVVVDGTVRETSRAAEPVLPIEAQHYHTSCYAELSVARLP